MQAYPQDSVVKAGKMKTDCILGEHPSLTIIRRAYGYDKAKGWVMLILTWFNQMYTTDRKMNDFQLESCAELLIQNFPTLKCTELALCLNRILSGAYGEVMYGNVEYTKITSVLNGQFREERARVREWDQRERERKERERYEAEEHITWEEYCRRTGRSMEINPISTLAEGTKVHDDGGMADFAEKKRRFFACMESDVTIVQNKEKDNG